MRTSFSLAIALATGLLVSPAVSVMTATPAHAEDAGLAFFEAGYKKMKRGAAKKFWGVVGDAKKSGLFQFAFETADYVLELDPNHKDARDYLRYDKKKSGWVRDEEKAAKLQKQNMKGAKESQKSFDKKVERWREKRAKADTYLADKYAQLGNDCAAAGYAEQAKKCFERALLVDKENEAAHKGAGHVKVGKLWMAQKKLAAIKKATEGKWISGEAYEKGVGVKLSAMESPHFRLYDDGDKAVLPDHIKALEVLYVYFLADVGIDPTTDVLNGKKIDLVVVSQQANWARWVDEFSNTSDKEWTKESNTSRSYLLLRGGVLRVETAEIVDTRDPLLHHAAHFLGQFVWNSRRAAWLDEGLAYYYTVRIQGTTRTSCLDKTITGYGNNQEIMGGDKDWTESERWRDYLRSIVNAKADTELRKILLTPLSTLRLPDSIKAWAVVTWLMEKKREKFIAFLKLTRDEKDLDQDATLKQLLGKEIEDIDEDWRAYARRAF